jgi:hypothetical protein
MFTDSSNHSHPGEAFDHSSRRPAALTTLQLRPCLAVLAIVILNVTYGNLYSPLGMAGVFCALSLALFACLGKERQWQLHERCSRATLLAAGFMVIAIGVYWLVIGEKRLPFFVIAGGALVAVACCLPDVRIPSTTTVVIASAALGLGGLSVFRCWLAFCNHAGIFRILRLGTVAGFGVVVAALLSSGTLGRRQGSRLLLVLLIAGAVIRYCSVLAVPDPVIDVYYWLRDAPAELMRGRNPYAATYANCYATKQAIELHMYAPDWDTHPAAYPPLPMFITMPFRALGLDVRYANVCCDLVAGAVLFLAACRRGNPLIGLLVAALYLNLPGVPYLIELSWYEPMVAAFIGSGLLLAEQGRVPGKVLLGLGLTAKQFGVPLLFPLLMGLRSQWRALLLTTFAVAVAVMLPFWLWDPQAFWSVVVVKQVSRLPDLGSNSLQAWLYHVFDWRLPRYIGWALAGSMLVWLTRRTPEKGTGAALWMGTGLLVFIQCNPVSYVNYVYLVEYLLLLGIAGLTEREQAGAGTHAHFTECSFGQATSRPVQNAA